MSKIGKLLSNPHRFVLDSRLYRSVARARHRSGGGPLVVAGITPPRPAPIAVQRAELLEPLAKVVPMLELTDRESLQIAVLRADLATLTSALHQLATRDDVALKLHQKSGALEVGRKTTVLEMDAFVGPHTSFFATLDARPKRSAVTVLIEVWEDEGSQYVGPSRNRFARRISKKTAEQHGVFRRGALVHARALSKHPLPDHHAGPIDVVYTWVNHLDEGWQQLYREAFGRDPASSSNPDRDGLERFLSRDELRFSLRSVARYAPWVRRVHVVTNCAPPSWVNLDDEKLRWVDHSAIFPADALPTFSSHAIESRLQHVPDLADRFLYFNDDVFLTQPAEPGDFFTWSGQSRSFLEDYAMVNGEVDPEEPDYLNAARNGRRLIEGALGCSVGALHEHTVHALRKDVLLELEARFPEDYARTMRSRVRSPTDVSSVSFLHHHYALLTGRAVEGHAETWLVKPHAGLYEKRLASILNGTARPATVCLNDGGGSASLERWGAHLQEFLQAYFPEPSRFERHGA